MRFLHAADIHLDSPLRGLSRYEGAPGEEIRQATRKALQNLVGLAIDERVDFVLIAGDLYDGDWQDHNTGLFFTAQMTRLNETGIPVLMIRGNHDAASKMSKSLRLPPNVTLLNHKRPQTVTLDDLGVAVHGQSFAKQAVTENIAVHYPAAVPGLLNIGLLHTSLAGAEGHENYAPCSTDDLLRLGYDYWALGHVHERRIVNENGVAIGQAPIVFSGNTQGRHIREPGPRGCYLVDVEAGQPPTLDFRPLDVFRWEVCAVNADEDESTDSVLAVFEEQLGGIVDAADGLPLAVRVEVTGRCAAHGDFAAHPEHWREEFRNAAIQSGHGRVWLEKIRFRTRPPLNAAEQPDDGPLEELRGLLSEVRESPEQREALRTVLEPLLKKLPTELTRGDYALPFTSSDTATDWLDGVLDSVEPLLVEHLRGEGRS
ncbi:MAG: metallophosphoesterase family protein [Planctomycetota bacterium]|jgi:DNA repair exonuclease SbcCD nuclease subunit